MNKSLVMSTLLALPLLIAATGETFAWSKNGFAGTRDQVRAGCAKAGGELVEGTGQTHCFNTAAGTNVSCYDDGTCDGSGTGPAPRIRLGMLDTVLGGQAAMVDRPVPESLTSGNSGSGVDAAPAPGDIGTVGQWHAQPPTWHATH